MAVFGIGQGARFQSPSDIDLFDATKALAEIAKGKSKDNSYGLQGRGLTLAKPIKDQLMGIDFHSPALAREFNGLMDQYGVNPEMVDAAFQHYVDSGGDQRGLTEAGRMVANFMNQPDVADVLARNIEGENFINNYYKNKDKYSNVTPFIDRAVRDFQEQGSTDGMKVDYRDVNLTQEIEKIKKQFTYKKEGVRPDYENLQSYTEKFTFEDNEGAIAEFENRVNVDKDFRDNLEGVAFGQGITTRNTDGSLSAEFMDWVSNYAKASFQNFGGQKDVDIQNLQPLTRKQIEQAVEEGKITQKEAEKIEEQQSFKTAAGEVITIEELNEILRKEGLPLTPENRAKVAAELKHPSKSKKGSTKKGEDEYDPTGKRAHLEAQDNEDNMADYAEHLGYGFPNKNEDEIFELYDADEWDNVDKYLEDAYQRGWLSKKGEDKKTTPSTSTGSSEYKINFEGTTPASEVDRITKQFNENPDGFEYEGLTGQEAKNQAFADVRELTGDPSGDGSIGWKRPSDNVEISPKIQQNWENRKWRLKSGVTEDDVSNNTKKIYDRIVSNPRLSKFANEDIIITSGERHLGYDHENAFDVRINDSSMELASLLLNDFELANEILEDTESGITNIMLIEEVNEDKLGELVESFGFDFNEIKEFSKKEGDIIYYYINNKVAFAVNPNASGPHLHIGPTATGRDFANKIDKQRPFVKPSQEEELETISTEIKSKEVQDSISNREFFDGIFKK